MTSPTPEDRQAISLWVASRAVVLAVAYVGVFHVQDEGLQTWARLVDVLTSRWDAEYYLRIASQGYPAVLPSADPATHHWGFYPLYGWLIAALGSVFPWSLQATALLINAVAGVAGVVLMGRWLSRHLEPQGVLTALACFSFWTQSYFFTYAYAESVYLVLLLASLLLLDRNPNPPRHAVKLALVLGLATGLCRPYAVVVAAAALGGAVLQTGARAGWRQWLRNRTAQTAAVYGVGVTVSSLYVWYGHCWVRTGVMANCAARAWTLAWGVGSATLPQALVHDVREILDTRPLELWHVVRVWELLAWVLAVALLLWCVRHRARLGPVATALAVLPLVTNLGVHTIRSVPRYMATTPTLFLVLGALHARPRVRAVVLVFLVVMHVVGGFATARGVWQSF